MSTAYGLLMEQLSLDTLLTLADSRSGPMLGAGLK